MSVHGLRSVLSDAKGASVGHRVYKPRGIKSPSPSPCTRGLTGCKVHAGTLLFQPAAPSQRGRPSERLIRRWWRWWCWRWRWRWLQDAQGMPTDKTTPGLSQPPRKRAAVANEVERKLKVMPVGGGLGGGFGVDSEQGGGAEVGGCNALGDSGWGGDAGGGEEHDDG